MKTIFIEAKSKAKINTPKIIELSKNLPHSLAIAYSIQFKDIAKEIGNILSESHEITQLIQVLGCSKPVFSKNTQAILLIGQGRFHAISLAYETKLPVFMLNKDRLEKISEKDLELIEKKQKISYLKFLNEDKIGILISTKPGQNRLKKAIELQNKLKDKKSYLFLANNINPLEFQNFGLSSWVNTACSRLDMVNNSIINISRFDNSLSN